MKVKITMTADVSKLASFNHPKEGRQNVMDLLNLLETHTVEQLMDHLSHRGEFLDKEKFYETKCDYEENRQLADMLLKNVELEFLD